MDETVNAMSVDRALKPKHKHLDDKDLIHLSQMPQIFSMKWIKFILNFFHEGKIWLDQPIQITKKMINQIIGLPMLAKVKSTKTLGWVELKKRTLAEWDGRGMKISSVTDPKLKFGIHIIAHKIYSSGHPNSISCEVVDLAYKVVKNNLSFDLVELLLNQLNKNMDSI